MIIDKTGKQVISNLRTDSNGNHYQRRVELAQIFELLNQNVKGIREVGLIHFKNQIIVYKEFNDFYILILASQEENELFLEQTISAIEGSLVTFIGKDLKLENLYNYLSQVCLILDEAFSEGLILTQSTEEICAKVMMKKLPKNRGRGIKLF